MTANLSGRSPEFYNYLEGLKVKQHAVKEIVADAKELEYLLCVEIEPQPEYKENSAVPGKYGTFFHGWNITHSAVNVKDFIKYSPIAIGDTVYQGTLWVHGPMGPVLFDELLPETQQEVSCESLETMPIELADKTFKVIGVEVKWMPRYKTSPNKPLADCDYRDLDEAWFWSYKLEEMKG